MHKEVPAPHVVDRSPLLKLAGSISAKVVVLTVIAVLVAVAIGVAGWLELPRFRGHGCYAAGAGEVCWRS
jgi:hypothetical protein